MSIGDTNGVARRYRPTTTIYSVAGTYYFFAPQDILDASVLGCGGGGAGGTGYQTGAANGFGGAGGSGAASSRERLVLTPGEWYKITVAAGGVGSSSYGAATNGGDTFIADRYGNELVRWKGGLVGADNAAGSGTAAGGASVGMGSGAGGNAKADGARPDRVYKGAAGGFGAASHHGDGSNGGGGGASLGDGGGSGIQGNTLTGRIGQAGVKGGGGGGGAGDNVGDERGGAGGPGYVELTIWQEH